MQLCVPDRVDLVDLSGSVATTGVVTKKIPWWEPPQVGPEEYELLKQVLDSNYLNDGKVTHEFERLLTERTGAKHAVAVTSGTAALYSRSSRSASARAMRSSSRI